MSDNNGTWAPFNGQRVNISIPVKWLIIQICEIIWKTDNPLLSFSFERRPSPFPVVLWLPRAGRLSFFFYAAGASLSRRHARLALLSASGIQTDAPRRRGRNSPSEAPGVRGVCLSRLLTMGTLSDRRGPVNSVGGAAQWQLLVPDWHTPGGTWRTGNPRHGSNQWPGGWRRLPICCNVKYSVYLGLLQPQAWGCYSRQSGDNQGALRLVVSARRPLRWTRLRGLETRTETGLLSWRLFRRRHGSGHRQRFDPAEATGEGATPPPTDHSPAAEEPR